MAQRRASRRAVAQPPTRFRRAFALAAAVAVTTSLLVAVGPSPAWADYVPPPVAACSTANANNPALLADQCEPTAPIPVNSRVLIPDSTSSGRSVPGMRIGRALLAPGPSTDSSCARLVQIVGVDRLSGYLFRNVTLPACSAAQLSTLADTVNTLEDGDVNPAGVYGDPKAPVVVLNTAGAPSGQAVDATTDTKVRTALEHIGLAANTSDITTSYFSAIGQAGAVKIGAGRLCRQAAADPATGVTTLKPAECNLSGYLEQVISPNPHETMSTWSFVGARFGTFDVHAPGSSDTSNTVTITYADPAVPAVQRQRSYTQTAARAGWFQVLEVDARTLDPIQNVAVPIRGAGTDERSALLSLAYSLRSLRTTTSRSAILFVVGVGHPLSQQPESTAPSVDIAVRPTSVPGWDTTYWDAALGAAEELRLLGGVPEAFLKLPADANYSLVTGLSRRDSRITDGGVLSGTYGQAMEASAARTPGAKVANLRGQLTVGRAGVWIPTGSTVSAQSLGPTQFLAPGVAQRYMYQNYAVPVAQPGMTCVVPEDTAGCVPGQLKAFNWWGQALQATPGSFRYDSTCATDGCLKLRDAYRNTSQSNPAAAYLASLQCGTACRNEVDNGCATSSPAYPYPGTSAGFTCADYTSVRDALVPELTNASAARGYYDTARTQWNAEADKLRSAADQVWSSVTAAIARDTELKKAQDEARSAFIEKLLEIITGSLAGLVLGGEALGLVVATVRESVGYALMIPGAIGSAVLFSTSDILFGLSMGKYHVGESVYDLDAVGNTLKQMLLLNFDATHGIGNLYASILMNATASADLAAAITAGMSADSPYYQDPISDDSTFQINIAKGLKAQLYEDLLPRFFSKLEVTDAPSYWEGDLSTHYRAGAACPNPWNSRTAGETDSSWCFPNDDNYNVRKNFTPQPWGDNPRPWASAPPESNTRSYAYADTRASSIVWGKSHNLFPTAPADYGYTVNTLPRARNPQDLRMLFFDDGVEPHRLGNPYPIGIDTVQAILDDGVWAPDFWSKWAFPAYQLDAANSQDSDNWRHFYNALDHPAPVDPVTGVIG